MVWTQIGKKNNPLASTLTSSEKHLTRRAENVAIDLESFANHASRPNVTTEDVLLLARKNPDLQQIMGEFVDERKGIKEAKMARSKAGGRRR